MMHSSMIVFTNIKEPNKTRIEGVKYFDSSLVWQLLLQYFCELEEGS